MMAQRTALGAFVLAAALATAWAGERMMSVQVKESPMRAVPSFLGSVIGLLTYGDRVRVLEEKPGWLKVADAAGSAGWMHLSALTPKRVVLKAGAADVEAGASGEEMALAGKGFNSDVEAQFRAQNRGIDFGPVDRMLKRNVSAGEMAAFLREGGVQPPQGGAR